MNIQDDMRRREAEMTYRNAAIQVMNACAISQAMLAFVHPDPKVAGKAMASSHGLQMAGIYAMDPSVPLNKLPELFQIATGQTP